MSTPPAPETPAVQVKIPFITIAKVIGAGALAYAIYELLPFFMLLFMSFLLAITFAPLAERIARRLGRTFAVLIVALMIGVTIILVGLLVVPALIDQLTSLYHEFPNYITKASQEFPQVGEFVKHLPQKIKNVDPSSASPVLAHLAAMGGVAVDGLSSIALIYVFMVYLLIDGKRVYDWCSAFFTVETKRKLDRTAEGIAPVISAYVIGQIITSLLCSLFTFAVLSWVGVPAAVVLAVLAGIFDVLPIVGFFLFAVPSALFALTVSLNAMLIVAGLFLVYHLVEAYLISPMIYGNRLRVSGIVVLLTLLVGATLGGIPGAIAILPVVASYPVIEEIWLAKYLNRGVVGRHKKVSEEPEGTDSP